MDSSKKLNKEDFNFFLNWLSNDSEKAGEEYELIRTRLISFFRVRNCVDLETLADETINRVALKLKTYDSPETIPKLALFHSFAKNIRLEYLKQSNREVSFEQKKIGFYAALPEVDGEQNDTIECFNNCLSNLNEDDRRILIEYYNKEKGEKIEARKKLSEDLGISINTLHIKIYRLRNDLKNCIEQCIEKKSL